MLDEFHRPLVIHIVEEPTNVRIEYPVHAFPLDPRVQRIQRLVRAASGTEPIREASKVHLIYLIENGDHSLLNDLVLQRCDAQRALPPVGFRYVDSPRGLCPVPSPVYPAVKICQAILQAVLILAPFQAVYSRRSIPLQGVIAFP